MITEIPLSTATMSGRWLIPIIIRSSRYYWSVYNGAEVEEATSDLA